MLKPEMTTYVMLFLTLKSTVKAVMTQYLVTKEAEEIIFTVVAVVTILSLLILKLL